MTGACQTINTRADGHLEITPAASTRGTQQPQLHPLVRPTSTTCPATSTAFPLELVPTSTPCPTSTTASPASPLHHLHHQQHLPHPGQHRPTHCTTIDSQTPPLGAASGFELPLKQNPHHQTPRETTNDYRSSSKAKDLPQADCQKRRPGCSRTPWHRGCPVKAAHRRRWHDTRKDDDTKTTAVRDAPHRFRPPSLH